MAELPELADLLTEHRAQLLQWLERNASGLLRLETAEDLAQGVHLRALERAHHFHYQGSAEFLGWLLAVAKQHVADRHQHWQAAKRAAGALLRITSGGGTATGAGRGVAPAAASRGPATRAEEGEELKRALAALELLPPRDRELVRGFSEGVDVDVQARSLGIGNEAAQKARARAVVRFQRAFALLQRAGQ